MNPLPEVAQKPGQAGVSLPANLSLSQQEFNKYLRNNRKLLGLIIFAYLNKYPAPMDEKLAKVVSLIIKSPNDEKTTSWKVTLVKNLPIEERAAIMALLRRAGSEAEELAQEIYDQTVSPEVKEAFDSVGGDTNGDGIFGPEDEGWKTYGPYYDVGNIGYLDYTKIPIMRNERAVRIAMAKDLYNSLVNQLQVGHDVSPAYLKQLEILAGNYREARPYLADVRARLHMRNGDFDLALQEYEEAKKASGQNLREFDNYKQLKKYEAQLSFLGNLAAIMPYLVAAKIIKEPLYNLGQIFDFAFINPGGLTAKNIEIILKYLNTHASSLPERAGLLKAQLIDFRKAAEAGKWQISVGGVKLNGPLSQRHLGQEIEILAPKTAENYYYAKITFGENQKYYFDVDDLAQVEPHPKNPFLVRIRIPVWKILGLVQPGIKYNVQIIGDMDVTARLYPFSRSEEGLASTRILMANFEKFSNHVIKKSQLNVRWVGLSHIDKPEAALKHWNAERGAVKGNRNLMKLESMIATLRTNPQLFPEFSSEAREKVIKILRRRDESYTEIGKISPKYQKAMARLIAIGDMYFTEGGGAYTALSRAAGWKVVKVEEPEEVQGNRDGVQFVASPRYIMHLEKSVVIGGKQVFVKMQMEYYTDTQSGYASTVRHLSDQGVDVVMVQGHRMNKLGNYLGGLPPYSGRRTPVAYIANHCDSWEGDVRLMAEYVQAPILYAPVATFDSVFPAAQVNLAFLNGLIDGLSSGRPVNIKMVRDAYRQANSKSSGQVWRSTEAQAGYDRMKDSDGDGLPDFIDPFTGKEKKYAYDRDKRELHIESGGKVVTLRNYTNPSEQILSKCISLKELRKMVRRA